MENYSTKAIRLLSAQRWLALAIVDADGLPAVSYVPFAVIGGAFGIVVSRLAAHSAPLLAGCASSVLLVDSDTQTSDAYTRARLSIGVTAVPQTAGSAGAQQVWNALESRQGETVRMLRALPDFNAILLEPVQGRLVLGFASAHDLSGSQIVKLLESAT
jgi:heme iron utilization protein